MLYTCTVNVLVVMVYIMSCFCRFLADQAGTYWYHTHLGTQRTMGAAGPLIVLPRHNPGYREDSRQVPGYRGDSTQSPGYRGDSIQSPGYAGDYYMMVTDWFIESSAQMYEKVKFESVRSVTVKPPNPC